MPKNRRLSDTEAHTLLCEAASMLSGAKGETVHAETALRAAEKVLLMMQLALLQAAERDAGRLNDPPPRL